LVFIVIDGLDASGKSTNSLNLHKFLINRGKTVCLRVHPSKDNLFGVKTQQFLQSEGSRAHFAAAFFFMLDVIRSILRYSWQEYDYIIFVRYLMGTAYLPSPIHQIAYHFFATIVPTSKFMFFLNVSEKEAHQRILQTRKTFEMFETMTNLIQIRQKALDLALKDNWTIINANNSRERVQQEIREHLQLSML
jgi:dTMP kinase